MGRCSPSSGETTNNWNGTGRTTWPAIAAPIFVDGNSSVETGIAQVTGLAFSTLQIESLAHDE